MVRPVSTRALVIGAIVLFVVGLTMIIHGAATHRGGSDDASIVNAEADSVGRSLYTVSTSARARAETLASNPRIRAGIETDTTTLRDMAKHDIVIEPLPNETIELFQFHQKKEATSLLRLPHDSAALEPQRGPAVVVAPGNDRRTVRVISVAPVKSIYENKRDVQGAVAVASLVDLHDVSDRLEDASVCAALTVEGQKPVPLTTCDARLDKKGPGLMRAHLPLVQGTAGRAVALVARGTPSHGAAERNAGIAALAAALAFLFAWRWAVRRNKHDEIMSEWDDHGPTPITALTPLSDDLRK